VVCDHQLYFTREREKKYKQSDTGETHAHLGACELYLKEKIKEPVKSGALQDGDLDIRNVLFHMKIWLSRI
jgi:hypothetical protein